MAQDNAASTALIIAAWFVGIFVALKYLPSLLKGGVGIGQILGSGSVGYGAPSYQIPIGAALQTNGLSPDSAQALANLYNVQQGYQPNGQPLTAAQQAQITPQYDSTAGAGSIPYVPLQTLPDSDYPTFSAPDVDSGGDPFGSSGADDSADPDYFENAGF